MPLRVRADCSCRAGASSRRRAVLDSMLDHSRNRCPCGVPPGRVRGRPPACGSSLQGPEEVLRRARCSKFHACSRRMLRLTRPDIGLRTEADHGARQLRRPQPRAGAALGVRSLPPRLSQLGCLGISPEILQAATRGELLSDEDSPREWRRIRWPHEICWPTSIGCRRWAR
jgi:hypothetical protein